ncbi:MAG: hypothetical protein ACRCST_01295 [Turicibacter sp.]
MIKSYLFLTLPEKFAVLNYVNRNETIVNSIEQLDQLYKIPMYLNGKGVLFYFDETKILASGRIILSEAKLFKTAFIYHLDCLDEFESVLHKLIAQGKIVATYLGATDIYLNATEQEFLTKLNSNTDTLTAVEENEQALKLFEPFATGNELNYWVKL